MTSNSLMSCSFCGSNQRVVRNLITGPSSHICNKCVSAAVDLICKGDLLKAPKLELAAKEPPAQCSFCYKVHGEPEGMLGKNQLYICSECLGLCVQILFNKNAPNKWSEDIFEFPQWQLEDDCT